MLLLFIQFAGNDLFRLLVFAAVYVGMTEYLAMALPQETRREKMLAAVAGTLFCASIAYFGVAAALPSMVVLFLCGSLWFLFRFGDIPSVGRRIALVCAGWLYVPLLLVHLSLLHGVTYGRQWVFLVLLIVMAGDTCAYFTGVSFGRRKLYPAVSPNKSIEGAAGGLAGSIVGALVAKLTFFPALAGLDCIALGVGLGVAGQLGDLFESLLKRSFQVKDSGTLIPGHGGILDRLDSLLFAFPLAYYYSRTLFSG